MRNGRGKSGHRVEKIYLFSFIATSVFPSHSHGNANIPRGSLDLQNVQTRSAQLIKALLAPATARYALLRAHSPPVPRHVSGHDSCIWQQGRRALGLHVGARLVEFDRQSWYCPARDFDSPRNSGWTTLLNYPEPHHLQVTRTIVQPQTMRLTGTDNFLE